MRYAPRVRVTVFIPTYNRAQLLRQTIESALGQSHADLGVVVSDNASTDETSAVVEGFDDPRIRYIRRSTNLGVVGNFNACLEEAKTEFTLIVPDDDLLHRDYLADAVGLLENHPKAGMVHTAFDLIGPAGEVLSRGVDWTFGLSDDTVERVTSSSRSRCESGAACAPALRSCELRLSRGCDSISPTSQESTSVCGCVSLSTGMSLSSRARSRDAGCTPRAKLQSSFLGRTAATRSAGTGSKMSTR